MTENLDAVLERVLIFPTLETKKKVPLRLSLLVPCFNEEKNIRAAALSWLAQSRVPDEIIVVDDSSTDSTAAILSEFSPKIRVIKTKENLGNKSYAQEFGLEYVTGDIVIMTDGDTRLDSRFIERIEEDFQDPSVSAVAGYVKSVPFNLLTACRAFDYVIGQNIDKVAQDYLDYLLVIPGAAGAFRRELFGTVIHFDHDTVTEDLDFTYKLHVAGKKIFFDKKAVCYTHDPADLGSYINQMRRWYAGGWQNFRKHLQVPVKPGMALELTLTVVEGVVFSVLLFILPILNFSLTFLMFSLYSGIVLGLATYAAIKERRLDILLCAPWYILLRYVHAWVYLEQFVLEIILRRGNRTWLRSLRFSP